MKLSFDYTCFGSLNKVLECVQLPTCTCKVHETVLCPFWFQNGANVEICLYANSFLCTKNVSDAFGLEKKKVFINSVDLKSSS